MVSNCKLNLYSLSEIRSSPQCKRKRRSKQNDHSVLQQHKAVHTLHAWDKSSTFIIKQHHAKQRLCEMLSCMFVTQKLMKMLVFQDMQGRFLHVSEWKNTFILNALSKKSLGFENTGSQRTRMRHEMKWRAAAASHSLCGVMMASQDLPEGCLSRPVILLPFQRHTTAGPQRAQQTAALYYHSPAVW